ncbi:hypothetical protein D9615_001202 [Tricholomella constricta]|uniref:Methionine aminopeptidase 2 n=1 Tax=Tricholomella constricta TaxID=117010 RepID=A0A8H5HL33_9AGAR|nr:hypothetical protein D9615_001202 [Tricholomella constricta]
MTATETKPHDPVKDAEDYIQPDAEEAEDGEEDAGNVGGTGEGKKKKKKKKPKKKKPEQSDPPRIGLSKFFSDGIYPEGEIQHYKDDNTWRTTSEEKRYNERMANEDPETTYQSIRRAAEVHRQVRQHARKTIRPGMTMTEIAENIEAGTRALVEENGLESGVGFPTGVSLNNCAAHYTPNAGDTTVLQQGDVLKVDIGVHVKGRIADSAFTLTFDHNYDKLLEAVKAATDTGVREAGIDVRLGELGGLIQETMESYEVEIGGKVYPVKPIENLSGHSINPYQIHGGKSVLLVKNDDQTKMEEGEYFAIETFGSTGRGRIVESGECSHYAKVVDAPRVPLRLTSAKSLLSSINKNFGTLPFCRRYLDRAGESKYLLALNHLVAQGIVQDYPPLCDQRGSMTAQFVLSTDSLQYYATPGVTPPSARVNPKLKIQPRRPLRIWDVWKYGVVVVSKATEITGDVLSHHVWGPRKKSWGIEMTIVSSIMRGAGRHSSLVDIATIRMLMSIGGLVPLPSDALVTPVTFRVKKRNLRGILAEFDQAENGTRELSGEWVVGKKTWQRLQAEWRTTRSQISSDAQILNESVKTKEQVILYIHGGAYYLSSAAAQRLISIPLSKFTDARVFALDYRLAPETRFPGPLHDVVSGYLRLVEDLHIPPENILLAGDSAGGGLCLALLMYLRDHNYSLPAGAILMSPWVDLTMSCESWDSNASFDVVPFPAQDDHMNPVALYLGERMEDYLTHPYASPLFGDFEGLPPLLIQVGDAEVLRDEVTLLAHKATLAGVDVRHELFEDAIHVFQAYPFLAATRRAFSSMKNFVRNILPQIRTRSPRPLNLRAELHLEEEIENENATVVRGDGVEIKAGMESVNDKLGVEDTDDPENKDNKRRDSREYPSWERGSRIWPFVNLPSPLDEDDEHKHHAEGVTVTRPPSPAVSSHPYTDTSEGTAGIRRIRSAVSLVAVPVPPTLIARPHHRKISALESRKAAPGHIRLPAAVMTKCSSPSHSPLHSPSLRRSSMSHPDIASLVENWSHTGPANQTMLYEAALHSHP